MTADQTILFAILAGALILFVWDRWRYDIVALLALLAAVLTGLVPANEAFTGFSDPVVTTVAAVLVISAAVRNSGILESVLGWFGSLSERPGAQVAVFVALVTAFSAFMNNVGALALFLPLALQAARKSARPASELLMPLSFGSLLGGLITLIGTPPNLLIARIRQEATGEPFHMFDFAPVGLGIAAAGIVFLAFGWRLIPLRSGKPTPEMRFEIADYVSEVRVGEDSPLIGKTIAALEETSEGDLAVVGVIRGERRRMVPSGRTAIGAGDILVVESDPVTLKRVIDQAKLDLVPQAELEKPDKAGDEIGIAEAVVMANSPLIRHSPAQLRLRARFNVNFLAVRRQDRPVTQRLSQLRLREGDVIVLQGNLDAMPETLRRLACLPLAERNLQLGRPRRALIPAGLLALSVLLGSLGLIEIAIALLAAVVVLVIVQAITLSEAYAAIDWPVIVLLGAMMPVTAAMESTGGTELLAGWIAAAAGALPPLAVLGFILVATMLVTPVLNNAATVLLLAPIAVGLATRLGLSVDACLMAVAVGASCDFLTPIGHQSNTLVMGPGGYRFGDYWRLGLPVSILVVVVGVPLIALVWGLSGPGPR